MADPAPTTPLAGDKKDNKDTLFGPNIGIVGAGPEWASDPSEKKSAKKDSEKVDEDELTPEIVKEWMKRSSDVRILLFVFRAVMVTSVVAGSTDDNVASTCELEKTYYPSLTPCSSCT